MYDDGKPGNRLGMSFSITRGRLLVYHATIMELGNPEYIRFLYNDGRKRFAVQCCEKIDKEGFRVPRIRSGEHFQFELRSGPLLSVIYKKCEWNIDKAYNVLGTAYPEHRLVEFKLDDAEIISSNQFMDPENAEVY